MKRSLAILAAAAAATGVALLAPLSSAQEGPTDTNGGAPAGNGNGGGGGGTAGAGGGGTSTSTAVPTVYGVVAPPPPGEPVGGGNATESSSRPVTGDKEDGFDTDPSFNSSDGRAVSGATNGPVFFERSGSQSTTLGMPNAPATHLVVKGDTLWGICDQAFQNPYQWPRIWSLNPQIQNPHWIYPNEVVRLKRGAALSMAPQVSLPEEAGGVGTSSLGRIRPGTIYLRDAGFVNDDATLNWGSIVGSPDDHMYLTSFDEVYVRVGPGHDVRIGQKLTIFRPVRRVSDGEAIAIQGTLQINDWNPETRIARAQVVETLDAVERGARVGPVQRSFEIVAPKRNRADVTAHVAISAQTHAFYGQNQVVFIDAGSDQGLEAGNRLFIVRRGDQWRQSMVTAQTARRIMGEREDPAAIENTPRLLNEGVLPDEVTAELRVVNVQPRSATCLVTQSRREVEIGELAVAHKGY
jgi:hypothetical protein